ncbi:MAG: hypothetical protein AAF944_19135 [Bacteroidota bacterium]
MNFNYFIGIDVSKKTLDFCLLKAGKALLHLRTENHSKGIESFIKQCQQQLDFKLEESLFCMEHTARLPPVFTIIPYLISYLKSRHLSGGRRAVRIRLAHQTLIGSTARQK